MINKSENPHAFAFAHSNFNDEWVTSQGMTLRDYFAAQALQGLIASDAHDGTFLSNAMDAYQYADMMLKARGMA